MIDSRAIIDPEASISSGVSIGPNTIIGQNVEIGSGTTIGANVVIEGPTTIGVENYIHPFASIGTAPQDKKYKGEDTRLQIGDRNVIREYCSINRGTTQDRGVTTIGDDNWIMAYVHIAHDCDIRNNTIFANSASLAGHVTVEDYAILGGFTLVHQFCRIGAHCFTAMNSVISKDVPPYLMIAGHMARPRGLNTEGLKRRGFSQQTLASLKKAYKLIYRSGLDTDQVMKSLDGMIEDCPEVALFSSFIKESTRGIIR